MPMQLNARPNGGMPVCQNIGDLSQCLATPAHAVPTVEFTVYNMELPLSQADYNFFTQPEINVFAGTAVQTNTTTAPARATSENLTDMTLTFDVPFVLMGICVYAYADPVGFTVPGNTFGPRASVAPLAGPAAFQPMSPDSLPGITAGGLDQIFTSAGATLAGLNITPATCLPAMLDWGGPAWRLLWAFMHSYRLEMKCPMSNYSILMNEALSDIGNCCGQVEWGGFGNSEIDQNKYVQRANDRMNTLAWPITNPAGLAIAADPGIFYPVNAALAVTAGGVMTTTPQRGMPRIASYGRPICMPTVEQWYRLPCPIPFPSVPQPKIKITLRQQNGDQDYLARLIQEGLSSHNVVMTGIGSNFANANPAPAIGSPTLFHTDSNTIPGGQLRVGLGLKGFEVRENVCEHLSDMLNGKFGNMQEVMSMLGTPYSSGVVSSPTDRISMPVGSMGDPNAR